MRRVLVARKIKPCNMAAQPRVRNWFRRNWERLHKAKPLEDKDDKSVEQEKPKKTWKHTAAKFALYGAMGYGFGQVIGWAFGSLGTLGGIAVAAAVGVAITAGSRLFGKKAKNTKKMGFAISLDMTAGEFVFPAAVGTAGYLSDVVQGPLSGLAVGGLSMIAGYLTGVFVFYAGWGLINYRKYRQTGFGSLKDLKQIPTNAWKTMKGIVKREPASDNKEVKAESFLAEFAEMHGKGIVWAAPYHALRLVAGLIAGFTPDAFVGMFTAVMIAVSPYIFPFYLNFYRAIEQRVNSVVDEQQPLKRNP